MHFRIGAMAVTWLTTIVLQLQDEGRLSLDDKLSRWYPDLPNADQITLRMLANSTSGYYDFIQGNQSFIDQIFANPFRVWHPRELLNTTLSRGIACAPGTCFVYSHTNYILLSRIVQEVTGRSTASQMKRRILAPLGLDDSRITPKATIPRPTLHAFTSDRGFYEDSTTWSPSWTLGSGTIATSTIDDIATAAPAIFSGALLSRKAYREMVAPSTAGFPPFSDSAYYGLGLIAGNGWRLENPILNGYSGVLGYLTHGKITVAITTTNSPASAAADEAFSQQAFKRFAAYLAPAHPPPLGP